MARKRKKTRSTNRRRRVSGIGGNGLQTIIGVAIGALGASIANNKMATAVAPAATATAGLGAINPKVLAIGELVAGSLIALKLAKGNALITGLGLGVAAVGAMQTAKAVGIVSGFRDMQVVSGNGARRLLRGIDSQLVAGVGGANTSLYNIPATSVISGVNRAGSGAGAAMN